MVEKVTERIFVVGGPDLTDPADALVYLIMDGNTGVLIDSGCGSSATEIAEAVTECGLHPNELDTIILTHGHIDHIGGANALSSISGAQLVAHELDAPAMETADLRRTAASMYGLLLEPICLDQILRGAGGTIEVGPISIEWAHTPGHTPGSIVLYLQEDQGLVIFGQDIHGPFSPAFDSDLSLWRDSMQQIMQRRPEILCEGHAGVIRGADRVQRFIRQHLALH
ncbi:MAG: MBL fold metallo-hydrolase [Candidatus Alcyoniella australis]|nr:MBL fold metallo-hydrolase [Candidatus Alcyoniella australis]